MSTDDDDAGVLAIEGEMTIYRAAELKQTLLATLSAPGPLKLDLAKVTMLDSCGVQLLLLARQLADARQLPFRLLACSPAVLEVLELLNLKTYLDGPASVPEAAPR